jgi:hypothetical protein
LIVPPEDVSSSYIYRFCSVFFILPVDGSTQCLIYGRAVMDPLKITPPFFYSYQCGSTLLTSYIPVHMYSVSLQILSAILTFIFVVFASSVIDQYPPWLLSSLPGVCWPDHWQRVSNSSIDLDTKPIRLVKPHQLVSNTMSNLTLLLSFGLCSPVLCSYLTLSICVQLSCWLMLIARFVYFRIDMLATSASPPPLLSADTGSFPCHLSSSLVQEAGHRNHESNEDPFLRLLNQQLSGVSSSLVVCKWPVTLTSCFFVTLLCWDMAGDKGGWSQALWVPIMGVGMAMAIWVWDRMLLSRARLWNLPRSWWCSIRHPQLSNPNPVSAADVDSLELVRPSLHRSDSRGSEDDVALDREGEE